MANILRAFEATAEVGCQGRSIGRWPQARPELTRWPSVRARSLRTIITSLGVLRGARDLFALSLLAGSGVLRGAGRALLSASSLLARFVCLAGSAGRFCLSRAIVSSRFTDQGVV